LSTPDINEDDRERERGAISTTIQIVVSPLLKRAGRYEVRGASGIPVVASSRHP
jgi:hypothetical protein